MPSDLATLLGDTSLTWTERRTRLQGWSGSDADQADATPGVQRIATAACAVGALAGASTGSPLLLAAFAATALVGAFAPNHPFEWLYNRVASTRGRHQLPANRAAKRLGCAIGVVFLGGSAVAFALGAPMLGLALALVLGGTAAFVVATGICVPSLVFTALWGSHRAAAPSLVAAARTPRHPDQLPHDLIETASASAALNETLSRPSSAARPAATESMAG
jgi:hypothetical protein